MFASTFRRMKLSQIQLEIERTLGKIITPAMPPLVRKPEKNPPMPVLSWMIPRLILRSVTVRKLLLLPLLDIGYSLEVNYTIFWQ